MYNILLKYIVLLLTNDIKRDIINLEIKEGVSKMKFEDIAKKYDIEYIGIRIGGRDLHVGDVFGNSRHNPDRGDERDFPEYGTEDYESMEELDGTCAYDFGFLSLTYHDLDNLKSVCFGDSHCYVIAGTAWGHNDDPDAGEVVIQNAEVLEVLF